MNRLAVIARLVPGAERKVRELLEAGPPEDSLGDIAEKMASFDAPIHVRERRLRDSLKSW